MSLSFIYPAALWLLLLLPLLWLFTLKAVPRPGRREASTSTQRVRSQNARTGKGLLWARLVLRSIILVALVLALAGIQLVRPVDNVTVVFLVDGSDSVSPARREQAIDYIDTALAERGDNDRAAVVVFGANALVEWAPTELSELERLTSAPVASRTNIAEAIRLGVALFPSGSQKRLVLLSDGFENDGDSEEAIGLARARNVPLDVVPLASQTGDDVLVDALEAPAVVREGQSVPLQVSISSSIETSGRLQIFADNELVDTQDIDIPAGTSTVNLNLESSETGFRRFEVRLEAQRDATTVNNRAAAYTTVQGPPQILLISSEGDRASVLQRVLEANNVDVTVRQPQQVSAEQEDLQQYAAVMLVDVLARDVPLPLQHALPVYVRDQGGGLAMIGGEESFGAGGWRRSPVADALPVNLDPEDTLQRPDVALVLVIDRSGSMMEPAGRNLTKLDLAKEAVYQSSLGLQSNDQIGVVGFDTVANWVLDIQTLPNLADIERALSVFNANGGTNIRSGIEPAAEELAEVEARTKHVILLTDGLAESNYADLIRQMREDGITISVVSIGVDANPALNQIADIGGGRFYRVRTLSDVPDIFLSETVIAAGRDIVESQFTPAIALSSPVVRGLGGLPPLYGYNATEQRPTARTLLVSPDGKPVLAQWQYGLGRSVAWTSDLKGQWARDWLAWSEFPRFINGLLNEVLPPRQVEGLQIQTRTDGVQTVIDLVVEELEDGRVREIAEIQGRLVDPNDEGRPLSFGRVGANRYRTIVETDEAGVYLAQIAALDTEGQLVGNITEGIVVSYSPEYRPNRTAAGQRDISPLLTQLAASTGGNETPDPETLFVPTEQPVGVVQEMGLPLLWVALLLWPLDIALRRLLLRSGDAAALGQTLRRPFRRKSRSAPVPAEATVARLQTARERMRASSEQQPTAEAIPPQTSEAPMPPATPAASPPEQQPRPARQPSRPAAPPAPARQKQQPKPPAPAAKSDTPAHSDEALASLLTARQRARRKGRENKE